MKILAVSDIEDPILSVDTKRIEGIDLIVSCGDLNESYLSFLSTVYGVPLFYVRGNHDLVITPELSVGENLHNRLVKFKGVRFLGFEGSLNYTRHAVQYSELEMDWMARKARIEAFFKGKPDIIVTHAPPKGVHEGKDRCHGGVGAFAYLIEKLHPPIFLHGHTHLNYQRNSPRMTMVGSTQVINVYGHYLFEI